MLLGLRVSRFQPDEDNALQAAEHVNTTSEDQNHGGLLMTSEPGRSELSFEGTFDSASEPAEETVIGEDTSLPEQKQPAQLSGGGANRAIAAADRPELFATTYEEAIERYYNGAAAGDLQQLRHLSAGRPALLLKLRTRDYGTNAVARELIAAFANVEGYQIASTNDLGIGLFVTVSLEHRDRPRTFDHMFLEKKGEHWFITGVASRLYDHVHHGMLMRLDFQRDQSVSQPVWKARWRTSSGR